VARLPNASLWTRRARLAVPALLAICVLLLAVGAGRRVWTSATAVDPLRSSDALPVYLSAAAIHDGLDPTTQESLKQAYETREMSVRAAIYSNLYPASTGVLFGPLAHGSWTSFVTMWRWLLLAGAVAAGAFGGLAAVRGPATPLAAALGVWMALAAFPVTDECIALGQVNLLVAGLMGVVAYALSRQRDGLAGIAAVLGTAVKLVPALCVWPLLAGRRWRGVAVSVAAGLVVVGMVWAQVPLDRAVFGVLGTLEFQSAITPTWMGLDPAPPWMLFLGALRHLPLGIWTILVVGVAAHLVPTSAEIRTAGAALAAAWIGADAAAFHVLYAPLYIPAWVYATVWVFDDDAPPWAALTLPLAIAPATLFQFESLGVAPEARLVVVGLLVWAGVLLRLAHHMPTLPRGAALALGLVAGFGLAKAETFGKGPAGPPPSANGVLPTDGLPPGVGHGGDAPGGPQPAPAAADPLSPSDPLRLSTAAGAEWDDRVPLDLQPVSAFLPSARAARLTGHLNQGPRKWLAVDHPLAKALGDRAPPSPAAQLPLRPLALYLATEHYAVHGGIPDLAARGGGAAIAEWQNVELILGGGALLPHGP
jgi:Glycosyltransferase family 87